MISMSPSAPNVSSTFTFGEFGGSCFAGGQSSNGATAVASAVAALGAAIRPMVASVERRLVRRGFNFPDLKMDFTGSEIQTAHARSIGRG